MNKRSKKNQNDLGRNIAESMISMGQGYNIVAVIEKADGSKDWYVAKNLVTDAGDRYYAQTIVGTTLSHNYKATAIMRLGTNTLTAAKGSKDAAGTFATGTKSLDANYPMVSDTDTDNTGSGSDIVTWRFTYGTADGNANNINSAAVCNALHAPTEALTTFNFASQFNKTSSDTLKVFVNHEMRGTS